MLNFAVSSKKEYFWSSLDFRYETAKFGGGGGHTDFQVGRRAGFWTPLIYLVTPYNGVIDQAVANGAVTGLF